METRAGSRCNLCTPRSQVTQANTRCEHLCVRICFMGRQAKVSLLPRHVDTAGDGSGLGGVVFRKAKGYLQSLGELETPWCVCRNRSTPVLSQLKANIAKRERCPGTLSPWDAVMLRAMGTTRWLSKYTSYLEVRYKAVTLVMCQQKSYNNFSLVSRSQDDCTSSCFPGRSHQPA